MAYRFVQGIDYGPRDGTLGLEFHMAEGGNGTLGYLARHPGEDLHEWAQRVNGVSCNALLLDTGEVVQMVAWGHASGNVNPGDRAGEYGYYGHHHLVDVLGTHWPDPNTWSISMEIVGWRGGGAPVPAGVTPGPNDKQVAAAIAWGKDMIGRYPSLRGTWGHHDQAPKACPGLTANMKAIFAGLGGHGLWTPAPPVEDPMGVPVAIDDSDYRGTCRVVGAGHAFINVETCQTVAVPDGWPGVEGKPVVYLGHAYKDFALVPSGAIVKAGTQLVGVGTNQAVFLRSDVKLTDAPAPPKDCTTEVAAAIAADRGKAHIVYS